MRLDLTNREVQILTDALAQPVGVSNSSRKDAERLREHLYFRLHGPPPSIPKLNITPIRSHWPDNHLTPDKKSHWSFDKPKAPKVAVNNSNPPTTKATVDNLLEGLI